MTDQPTTDPGQYGDAITSLTDSPKALAKVTRERDEARAALADERRMAGDLAAALLLVLHDAHPVYGNTAGWRGGVGGQTITRGCALVDPPPGFGRPEYDMPSQ